MEDYQADGLANILDGITRETGHDLPIKIVDAEGDVRQIEDIRIRQGADGQWIQIDIADPQNL